jgi:acetaldehyde dehydrogenase
MPKLFFNIKILFFYIKFKKRKTNNCCVMNKIKVAIIGSGNIGTDLMIKVLRLSKTLEIGAFVGIDPNSDGLLRAENMGIPICATGIDGLVQMEVWNDIKIIFDATSAKAHSYNYSVIEQYKDKFVIDLTPAAIGDYVVPAVNLDIENLKINNVNMVTCGGQATIPIVAAISKIVKVHYGEIVASIASKSAGVGTRANIDEFTETTALAIEKVGKADKGKAIIVLNPAEPPLVMRDTVFTLSEQGDRNLIRSSVIDMVETVQQYVAGYTLHQEVQFDDIAPENPVFIEGLGYRHGLKTTVLLKVEGAGHYLPKYAGNLDIMTSAALATAEKIAKTL